MCSRSKTTVSLAAIRWKHDSNRPVRPQSRPVERAKASRDAPGASCPARLGDKRYRRGSGLLGGVAGRERCPAGRWLLGREGEGRLDIGTPDGDRGSAGSRTKADAWNLREAVRQDQGDLRADQN